MDKDFYMQEALNQAKLAFEQDEVPIGAVIVNPKNGDIVAAAYNLSEHGTHALAHAEILVMDAACQKLGTNRLRGMDLYVTLEPCTMCAAAISFMRIEHLYFGAYDVKGGAVASGVRFYDSPTCHHRPQVDGGICEESCSRILKDFFKMKRSKK